VPGDSIVRDAVDPLPIIVVAALLFASVAVIITVCFYCMNQQKKRIQHLERARPQPKQTPSRKPRIFNVGSEAPDDEASKLP